MSIFESKSEEPENEQKQLKKGEYWKVRNGLNFLYSIIVNESPLGVQYFAPTREGKCHILNEAVFNAYFEDLEVKIKPPKIIQKGRCRQYYMFTKQ